MQGGKTVDQRFDVLIIGAGVVGSAAARELAQYQLKIGVLEKNGCLLRHQCQKLRCAACRIQ